MKKLIAFLILFTSLIQAQGVFLLVGSSEGSSPRDSVPNSYLFVDQTDVAVSTQITSAGVVLAGFDSAYVNVTGGDYKIGALGSITRAMTMIHLGDTLFAVDTSSASNSTTTNVPFDIAGVVDTFSVTTVAGGDTLGVNLLNNSTFESALNSITDWEVAFGATIERSNEQAYAGTYSAKVITAGAGTGIVYYADGNYVPVVVDSVYWIEGYYYLVSGAAQVYVQTPLGNSDNFTVTNTWTYFKFQVTATSTAGMYLRFVEVGAGGNTTFYLDNVTMKRLIP